MHIRALLFAASYRPDNGPNCAVVTFGASNSISSKSPCRPFLATQSNWRAENTVTEFTKATANSRLLLVARGRPILL